MPFFKEKIRLVYLPFLKVALLTNLVYSLLFWLVVIKFEWININNNSLFAFLLLITVPIGIWLWPKNRLLRNGDKNSAPGLSILQFILMALLVIGTANFITIFTGKITHLQNIEVFEKVKPTKYYSVKNYFLNYKSAIYNYSTKTTSSKGNTDYNMYINVLIPILNTKSDTIIKKKDYWAALNYEKKINNNTSDSKKENAFNNFKLETEKELNYEISNGFTYMEEVKSKVFENLVNKKQGSINKKSIFFELNFTPFANRCNTIIIIIFLGIILGSLLFFLILINDEFEKEPITKSQKYYNT